MRRTELTKAERHRRIVEAVRQSGDIALPVIASSLGCASITVRRDIEELHENMPQIVIEGGHVQWISNRVLRQFEAEMALKRSEKEAIARAVVDRLQPGMTVAIDGGTTTTYVARELIRSRHVRPITVLTNAVNIAYELYGWDDVHVIALGGTVATQKYEVVGSLLTHGLERFWADVAILGCYGVMENAVTAYTQESAEASQAMLGRARKVLVACDRTKFGRAGTATICEVRKVDMILTDGLPSGIPNWLDLSKVVTVSGSPERGKYPQKPS